MFKGKPESLNISQIECKVARWGWLEARSFSEFKVSCNLAPGIVKALSLAGTDCGGLLAILRQHDWLDEATVRSALSSVSVMPTTTSGHM